MTHDHPSRLGRVSLWAAIVRAWALLVVVASASSPAAAQTLHFISIAASDDATIGEGTAANASAMADYAATVANLAGLTQNALDIRGAQFTCETIRRGVAQVAPGPDDVILLHYSGHGFVPGDEPRVAAPQPDAGFPWLFCDGPGTRPNLFELFEELFAKGARLTIVGADACNVVLPGVGLIDKGAAQREAIRAMYRDFRGGIAYSSSKRGQYSWYYPSGGIFTGQLLRTLRAPPSVRNPRDLWDASLKQASRKIRVNSADGPVEQTPIFALRRLEYFR